MPRTTSFDAGTVVLVRFPFTDLSGSKQRPALVISSTDHQRAGRDVIVAAISGQGIDDPGAFDHRLVDWESAGLLVPSVVRCGKVVTLERSLIRRRLGRLGESDWDGARSMIGRAVSL